MKLKYKILLSSVITILLTLGLIGFNYVIQVENDIKKLSVNQLRLSGEITKDRIEQSLSQMESSVKLFNSRLLLNQLFFKYQNQTSSQIKDKLQDILTKTSIEYISDIFLLDSDGNMIVSKTKTKLDQKILKTMFYNSILDSYSYLSFENNTNIPFLYISAPLYKNNTLLGVTIFKITINYLNSILKTHKGLGNTGEILAGGYNQNKDIVLFTPLRFASDLLVIKNSNKKDAIPMRFALEQKKDTIIKEAFDYRPILVISSVMYYNKLNIGIIAKKDINELMLPINELKFNLLMMTIFGIFVTIIISYYISNSIAKSINDIINNTKQIANGDYNKRIEIYTNDELGVLSKSINKMASNLVESNLSLEFRVKEKTKALNILNNQLEHIFNITPNITLITDGKIIYKVNKEFLKFTKYKNLEDFLKEYDCICDLFVQQTGYLKIKMDGVRWTEYVVNNPHLTHRALINKDSEEYLFLVNISSFNMDSKNMYLVVLENITALQRIAYTDQLTSLANRFKLDEVMDRYILNYDRYKTEFSILLIDIDHFKMVNDTYGHLVGDDVLKAIARILNEQTRKTDVIGRWGGEEFIIISTKTTLSGAYHLATKIKIVIENNNFDIVKNITVSIGVSEYKHNDSIDTLIKRADDALYYAKENGRNQVVIGK